MIPAHIGDEMEFDSDVLFSLSVIIAILVEYKAESRKDQLTMNRRGDGFSGPPLEDPAWRKVVGTVEASKPEPNDVEILRRWTNGEVKFVEDVKMGNDGEMVEARLGGM
jgi:hypothetical protein